MTIENIQQLGDRLTNILPQGVHAKIREILNIINEGDTLLGSFGQYITEQPLQELISMLENKEIKPILAMKKLQQQLEWTNLFSEGIKNGVDISACADLNVIKSMRKIYLRESGSGKSVSLKNIMDEINISECLDDNRNAESRNYKDITSSNVIVALSEILYDIEEDVKDIIPNIDKMLSFEQYDQIDLSRLNRESEWIKKQILDGNISEMGVINLINSKRREIMKSIRIHQLLKPLLKESHILVSLMPILMTMLLEEREGLEKIREDCNAIFNEFTMGASLELLTLSLKEKIGKSRDIEDIQINIEEMNKNFKRTKDAINHNVLSYLRRMKLKTIIDEETFNKAMNIGLDFTGLNSKFGVKKPPENYNDIKLEATQKFSNSLNEYVKLMKKRVEEERGINFTPNLVSLDHLISTIKKTIEKVYLTIPVHIAPLYGGCLCFLSEGLDIAVNFLEPLREKPLIQILSNPDIKNDFYSNIKKIQEYLEKSFIFFENFLKIGQTLTNADQIAALTFTEEGGNEEKHKDAYSDIFRKSLKNIDRMIGLRTLSPEDAESYVNKLIKAQEIMQKFCEKITAEEVRTILDAGFNR